MKKLQSLLLLLSFFLITCKDDEPLNKAPVIEAQNFSVSEDAENGILVGVIQASDPDSDILIFEIQSGNTDEVFGLSENAIIVTNSKALDFESTPEYKLIVEVTDGQESVSATITVTVTNGAFNYNIQGVVQKGPFVSGSTVVVQELNDELVQTGNSFSFETNNDFGQFKFLAELSNTRIEVQTTGFYFNEVAGELVDANLTLRAIADIENSTEINVNILTTLAKDRIKKLIEGGQSFEDAKIQSETEILQAFNLNNEVEEFITMDISQAGEKNAILLAISVIAQGDRTVANFSEFLSKLNIDLGDDGQLSTDNIADIQTSAIGLSSRLLEIRGNLEERYQNLGLSEIEIPNFEPFVIHISDQPLGVTTIPDEGASQVVNDSIILKFNSPVVKSDGSEITNSDISNLFELRENGQQGSSKSIVGSINNEKNEILILADPYLNSATGYYLIQTEMIKNIAEKELNDFSLNFTTGHKFEAQIISTDFANLNSRYTKMHYHSESGLLLFFDFFNEQIVEYDPVSGNSNLRTFSIPEGSFLSDVQDQETQISTSHFFYGPFIYDLSSNNWTDLRTLGDDGMLHFTFQNSNYFPVTTTSIYGLGHILTNSGEDNSIGFFEFDLESMTESKLLDFDLNGFLHYEYRLDYNPVVYNSIEDNLILTVPSDYDNLNVNETFYYIYDFETNSLNKLDIGSGGFDEGTTSMRHFSSAVFNSLNNSFIIYAGIGGPGEWHNDVWTYLFESSQWVKLENAGELQLKSGRDFSLTFVPELRAMFLYGGFGGGTSDNYYSDLIKVNLH